MCDSSLKIWVSLFQYTTSEHIHVHDSENHARSSVTIVSSILVSLGCKFAPRSSPNQLWTHINRTKIMCILTVYSLLVKQKYFTLGIFEDISLILIFSKKSNTFWQLNKVKVLLNCQGGHFAKNIGVPEQDLLQCSTRTIYFSITISKLQKFLLCKFCIMGIWKEPKQTCTLALLINWNLDTSVSTNWHNRFCS